MTAITDYEDRMTIEVTGTFDIAVARNRLRQLADRFYLPTVLRARASAAITTICELVLFRTNVPENKFHLTMIVLNDDTQKGVEFQFLAPLTTEIVQHFVVAEWQLERACDELVVSNRGHNDFIIMRLWAKRGRV
jgi:hypothetical protein